MKIEMANLNTQEVHELLGGAVVPLPIAFISTTGKDGTYNAAPFSLVTPVSYKPPAICVSFGLRQGKKKDTLANIEATQDFVVNIMDETLIKPVAQAAEDYAVDVDEISEVGLTAIAAEKVKAPLIAEAQISLECRLIQKLELGEGETLRGIVLGEVLLVHIKDNLYANGKIDPSRLKAVGRLGNDSYCRTTDIFSTS